MRKRSNEPSLTKIIGIIVLIGGVVFAIVRGAQWFNEDFLVTAVEESAETDLARAQSLIAQGNTAEAKALLAPIIARVDNPSITPKALMLLADIEQRLGRKEQALELLYQAAYKFATSPDQPKAAIRYAQLLEEQGQTADAINVYREVSKSAPPDLRAPAHTGLGREAMRQGNLVEAREFFRKAVNDAPYGSTTWDAAIDGLGEVNVSLIFAPGTTPESKIYTVVKGDTLTAIGAKLNTTQGLLIRANGIKNPARLRLGQRLKYTPKDFAIVVERSSCRLLLTDKDGIFKRYEVGLGRQGHETTLGAYKVGSKMKDPPWDKPGFGRIEALAPNNELGTRWMPMVPVEEGLPTDLGIHGTIHPESIGKYASSGCPRLHKHDVEELYDLVVRSTPVRVVEHWNKQEANRTR